MAKTRTPDETEQTPVQETSSDGSSQDDQSPTQAVAMLARSAGEIVTRQQQQLQTFIDWLVSKADTTDDDQYNIMASIVSEILDSANAEEVLREQSTLHARDILNKPLLLHGFEIREGKYEDSATGHYAAMHMSAQGSAATRVVTTGALKILVKLMKLDEFGEWPQIVMFTARETTSGNTVLDMQTPSV